MSDYEPQMGVYESQEGDFCAARDEVEALHLWAEEMGEDENDYDASEWTRLPDEKVLGCVNDDGTEPERKTCAEWAKGEPRYLFSRDD